MVKGLRRTSKRLFVDEFDHLKLGQFLLEHGDVLVFRLDARGKVQFANEFAQRELGYTSAEIEGRDFFGLLAPAEKERLGKLVLRHAPALPVHARASCDPRPVWRKTATALRGAKRTAARASWSLAASLRQ